MRIQNGKAVQLKLNVHTFGALYEYEEASNTFKFVEGEDLDLGGTPFPVEYPDTVYIDEQNIFKLLAYNDDNL